MLRMNFSVLDFSAELVMTEQAAIATAICATISRTFVVVERFDWLCLLTLATLLGSHENLP